nr:PREDICTED: alpha-amylase A-like [Bemisia tabaci]
MQELNTFILLLALTIHVSTGQFDTGMKGDRRVVVQLFEWPFDDIREECRNILGPQKFGAVLVSSVTENAAFKINLNGRHVRPWYERYQIISWDIRSRLGTEQQFKSMVEECNKHDVSTFFDGDVVGAAGTHANVKTKTYPGLGYTSKNFHEACPMDFDDRIAVRVCELEHLQDVNQTQPYVQNKIVSFLNKLIDFGVAGFRIDAAKHMWPEDLRNIYSRLKNVSLDDGKIQMRPIWMLENFDDDGLYQEDYKDIASEYDFAFQRLVTAVIKNGVKNMSSIHTYAKNPIYKSKTRQDFGTNHDLQRLFWDGYWEAPNISEVQQAINSFMLTFSRETPNIFSGYSYAVTEGAIGPPSDRWFNIISPQNCTDGWMCDHRYKSLLWIIKYFTNFVQDAPVESWWSEWPNGTPYQAAFTRGQKGFAVFNADTEPLHHTFQVPLPAGVYCDLATGFYCHGRRTCVGSDGMERKVEVKEDGTLKVALPGITRHAKSLDVGTGSFTQPPYIVISLQSMYPTEEDTKTSIIETLSLTTTSMNFVVGVAFGVVAAVVVLVGSFLLRRQFKSEKDVGEES